MGRFQDLSKNEIKKRLLDVAQYGLPGKGAAELIDVGTSDYLQHFNTEILKDHILQGGATCRFYEGPYGAGKSHLLKLIQSSAQSQGCATVYIELGQAVKLEDWKVMTRHILSNLRMDIDGETVKSLGSIARKLGEKGMADIDGFKRCTLPHSGLKRSLSLLANSEEEELTGTALRLLERFSKGDKVYVRDLRRYRIRGVKGSLTNRNAELFLNSALTALFHLSGRGTILLFDENEKSFVTKRARPSKKVVASANLMRRFIDSCMSGGISGTFAAFAILTDFLQNCAQAYPALGQRLETDLLHKNQSIWRFPVSRVSTVSTVRDENHFLEDAAELFADLSHHCGGSKDGLYDRLLMAGLEAMESQAGEGFRRAVMCSMAKISIQSIP